jgi:hypothetical protein
MTGITKSLQTVCYILTAPWQNWKVAIHQILLMPENSTECVTVMNLWRKNRKTEYSTVTIVVSCSPQANMTEYLALQGTIVASVAISSITGTGASLSHWTVLAFWHGTLTFAVLIAFYLGIFIDTYETCPEGVSNLLQVMRHEQEHAVNWVYMFLLQSPIMLICYAIVSYVVGLLIFMLQPLWQTEWGNGDKVRKIIIAYVVSQH